jgi:plasmid stabilization system protein ParE
MSLLVTFHYAARAEFIEASAWYESKRSGLALEFMEEIERCVLSAAESPYRFPAVHEDIRRVLVQRFPYSVFFRPEANRIVILAVFHSKRAPAVWLGRT